MYPRDPTKWNLTRKLNVTRIESIVQLDKKLGQGAFGVVYRGRMLTTGRTVAVKEQSINTNAPLIQSEIEALYRVMESGCGAYAIEVYDVIYDSRSQLVYIIMEYMPGGDLHDYIIQHALPRDETDPKLMMLCRVLYNGINCIHNGGMAHRDIKPPNVLFNADGQPKLSDFGISCVQRCYFDGGTPSYQAPEIRYSGGRKLSIVDEQIGDFWAVGCTIFELVTHRVYSETAGGLSYVSQRLFPNVFKLLQATFERDPTTRLQRWRALTDTLGALTAPITPRAAAAVTQPVKKPAKAAQPIKQPEAVKPPIKPTPFRVQEGPLPIAIAKPKLIPPPPLQPEPLKEQAQPKSDKSVYDFVFDFVPDAPPRVIEVVKTPAKAKRVLDQSPQRVVATKQQKRVLDEPPQRVVATKQQQKRVLGQAPQRVPALGVQTPASPEGPVPMDVESPYLGQESMEIE